VLNSSLKEVSTIVQFYLRLTSGEWLPAHSWP